MRGGGLLLIVLKMSFAVSYKINSANLVDKERYRLYGYFIPRKREYICQEV
jgi:hypothetical protein